MHRAAPAQHPFRLRTPQGPGRALAARLLGLLLAALLAFGGAAPPALAAEEAVLTALELTRDEDGLYINFAVDVELSHAVEDALAKGVPLFFLAEAQVFRDRWYWRDRRVADAVRVWRVVYQPLTTSYRVTFGGLTQTYASRAEAIAAISRGTRWKIAEPGQIEEGRHYVEFSYRLDTTLLPRPMQIGVGGQPEWQLSLKRTVRLN